jgi:hypothetical protein
MFGPSVCHPIHAPDYRKLHDRSKVEPLKSFLRSELEHRSIDARPSSAIAQQFD